MSREEFRRVSVIRSDLFGRTVPAPDQQPAQELESPPPPKKAKRQRGEPRIFSITQGSQAGQSAELAAGVIMIGLVAAVWLVLQRLLLSRLLPLGGHRLVPLVLALALAVGNLSEPLILQRRQQTEKSEQNADE